MYPMAWVRLLTKPRANKLCRYPSLLAVLVTRSRTLAVILESFFKARETVAGEMSSALAISLRVTVIGYRSQSGFDRKILTGAGQTIAQQGKPLVFSIGIYLGDN